MNLIHKKIEACSEKKGLVIPGTDVASDSIIPSPVVQIITGVRYSDYEDLDFDGSLHYLTHLINFVKIFSDDNGRATGNEMRCNGTAQKVTIKLTAIVCIESCINITVL